MKHLRKITWLLILCLLFTGCGPEINESNTEEKNHSQSEIQSEQVENKNTEEADTSESEMESEIESETESEAEVETKLYAKTNVNVRGLPSTSSDKVGSLSMNEEVIALGDAEDGWQKIRYKDSVAYVSANSSLILIFSQFLRPSIRFTP